MELYLKRYFWVLRLAFIALAAVLVARIANTFIGARLEPAPSVREPEVKAAPIMPTASNIDDAKFGHLFGIEPPPKPAEPSEAEKQAALAAQNTRICWDCAPVKTNLRLQLLGTMAANEKRWSMALITDLDKQATDYYVVGDAVKGAKIYDIIRDPQRVVVVNEETHRLEYIDAVPGSGAAVNTAGLNTNLGTAPVPAPSEPGNLVASNDANGDKVEGIAQKSENEYSITKQKLDSTLSNLNEVATQARIVPSFKNGVANGFKLFSIRPGSIYSGIGVQNGDVITRINGYDINSPDKALEIYSRLKDARNVEIDIERRGQIIKKRYSIDGQ